MPYTSKDFSEPYSVDLYIDDVHSDNIGYGNRPQHGKVSFSRSGTNSPAAIAFAKKRRSANAVYVWVPTPIRKGPKLHGYVWSQRLKKMVRRRAISSISWRLVRKKSTVLPKPIKGLDLPPNPLSYISLQTSYYGVKDIVHKSTWTNRLYKHSGDLTQAFRPFNGSAGLPVNPSTYSTYASLSGQLAYLRDEADSIARTRLYEKAKNQSVNLAQALAERKQLSGMLVEIAKKLLKFYVKLKAGNLYAAAAALFPTSPNQLADVHLMYRYGVKPLINDLEGITKALATDQDVYYQLRTSSKKKLERTLITEVSSNYNGVSCKTRVYVFGEVKVIYDYRVRIKSGYDALIQTLSSLGFANPSSLAYELTPFSFVVDWFIPIGNYLNNMDAFNGLSIDKATKTVLTKQWYVFEREFVNEPTDPYYRMVSGGLTGFVTERFTCDRTLMTDVPVLPTPEFSVTSNMIKRNAATALALIIQLKR